LIYIGNKIEHELIEFISSLLYEINLLEENLNKFKETVDEKFEIINQRFNIFENRFDKVLEMSSDIQFFYNLPLN